MDITTRTAVRAISCGDQTSQPETSDRPLHRTSVELPNLFVVGPAKSGTTALYHYFKSHPQVYTTPIKETNYMAFYGGLPPLAGPDDYANIGATSTTNLDDYRALFANRRAEPVAVDVSPSYMHYPQAATKIAELCPSTKIVIVLRNPVECAFSMYSMLRRDNRETCRTFREALDRCDERRAAGWDIGWDYLRSYLFSQPLARYLELFPASQLFIRRYECLKREPEQFYADLCGFLRIDSIDVRKANREVNKAPTRREMIRTRNGGRWMLRAMGIPGIVLPASWRRAIRRRVLDAPALEMNSHDRKVLIEYFRADILKLSALLSWDLSDWIKAI